MWLLYVCCVSVIACMYGYLADGGLNQHGRQTCPLYVWQAYWPILLFMITKTVDKMAEFGLKGKRHLKF